MRRLVPSYCVIYLTTRVLTRELAVRMTDLIVLGQVCSSVKHNFTTLFRRNEGFVHRIVMSVQVVCSVRYVVTNCTPKNLHIWRQ